MWCTFQDAQNENVYLSSANISLENCTIKNAPKGLWVNSSSPTLVSVVFENMSEACVYHNNACTVTYASCTMKDSYIGVRYETCTRDFVNNANITFENNTANIGMPGGDINVDKTWDCNSYAILGSIRVLNGGYNYSGTGCKLTLSPGSTLKFAENTKMQISYNDGSSYRYPGQLNAIGTEEQPITFTSLNGEVGGWNGLYFHDYSDYYTGQESVLKHCIIENGSNYNLHLSSTNQPSLIEDCIFRNSALRGVYMYNSFNTIRNCVFENNADYGLYYNNPHYVGVLENLTFTGNLHDGVATEGGDINNSRTWNTFAEGATYYILGSIRVLSGGYNYNGVGNKLTLSPGSTLKFAENTNMQISYNDGSSYRYPGRLDAIGTEEQPITFTSMNGEAGGWKGLYFHDYSDYYTGQESVLKHCIIENGSNYNLHLSSTNQPSLIEDCIFRNSALRGVYMYNSFNTIRNCVFENNADYGLYYNNPHYVGVLENLTFTGNLHDGVATEGGDINNSRTWNTFAEGATYYILGSIRVLSGGYNYNGVGNKLTLSPGSTLKFAENTNMQISYNDGSSYRYPGRLDAIGTEEQPITFTSMNGEAGGWKGLYFHDYSDYYTGQESVLKHCIIENGSSYNLHLSSTNQPSVIEDCVFQNANGYGLYFYNSSPHVNNCIVRDNGTHGIYLNNNANPIVGCSPEKSNCFYNNGSYAVYQDGSSNINMSYNFWGNIGHQYIDDNLIYDKLDNSSKGRITYEPVCWFPPQHFDYLYGTFAYNDNKQLGNLDLEIIDINDSIVASTTTDANGQYGFNDYSVNVYNTMNTDFGVDILAGVNATDALLTMRHFVHLDTLTDAQFAAADVNGNGVVNGTDAMLILRRTINEAFPAGDFYYFNPNGMTISGDTCHYDLSFLCYGDVNGSYTPQSRNSITLMTEGELLTDSYQEMVIPVRLKTAVNMGALTLHLGYPAEALEIQDIVLAATGESLLFVANNGELRTAWYSLDALTLSQGDLLINLLVHTNDLSLIDEPNAFTMEAYSELADGNAQALEGVVIAMPVLTTPTMSVSDHMMGEEVSVSVYPNPANDECHVKVELPEAGCVKVEVYNMLGVKVMDVSDAHCEAGSHELLLVTSPFSVGVYQCRVIFEGARSWVKSNVIIIEK